MTKTKDALDYFSDAELQSELTRRRKQRQGEKDAQLAALRDELKRLVAEFVKITGKDL